MDKRLTEAKTVIFDVGNVLLDFDADYMAETFFPSEMLIPELFPALFGPEWKLLDRGTITAKDAARSIATHEGLAGREGIIERFILEFPDMMPKMPLADLISPLKDMGKGVYALTNFPEPAFTRALNRNPFFNLMDGYVVSARLNLCKPEPAFYRALLKQYSLDPAGCVFIDDNEDNVEAARLMGIRAILCEDGKLSRD